MIAERAGAPVAYALVGLNEGPSGWDCGERIADVETLAVAPAARGQGVGTRLMDAIALMRSSGRMQLWVPCSSERNCGSAVSGSCPGELLLVAGGRGVSLWLPGRGVSGRVGGRG